MLGQPLSAEEVGMVFVFIKKNNQVLIFRLLPSNQMIYKVCLPQKVDEFMAEADVDQNGKLDYDEFSRMLLREPLCGT